MIPSINNMATSPQSSNRPLLPIISHISRGLLILVLSHTIPQAAAQTNNNPWQPYPQTTWPCLDRHASDAWSYCNSYWQLTYWDTATVNYCLCNNGYDFVPKVASCIYSQDPDSLDVTYGTFKAACASTGTPISFAIDDWRRVAGAAATDDGSSGGGDEVINTFIPTTTTRFITSIRPTPSTPPETSSSGGDDATPDGNGGSGGDTAVDTMQGGADGGGEGGGGLNQSDKIAIGIGVPVGVFTIIGAVVAWWMCCCR